MDSQQIFWTCYGAAALATGLCAFRYLGRLYYKEGMTIRDFLNSMMLIPIMFMAGFWPVVALTCVLDYVFCKFIGAFGDFVLVKPVKRKKDAT